MTVNPFIILAFVATPIFGMWVILLRILSIQSEAANKLIASSHKSAHKSAQSQFNNWVAMMAACFGILVTINFPIRVDNQSVSILSQCGISEAGVLVIDFIIILAMLIKTVIALALGLRNKAK